MKELLIVRHGQTEWNAQKRVMGRKPIPLNEKGVKQAHGISNRLKNIDIDFIYTSPVARAKQTSEIIAINQPNANFCEANNVQELDFGNWVGSTFDELFEKYSEEFSAYFKTPDKIKIDGGESLQDALNRIGNFVEDLKTKHENDRVLIVSHADPIKMIMLHLLELPLSRLQTFSIDNCALVMFRFDKRTDSARMIIHNLDNGFDGDM